jgi:electron transport complex protein RnfC
MSLPDSPFKTHGGVNVPHRKNTAKVESAVLPSPDTVILPMQQHVGAPCAPCVKAGDHVLVGQKIADSTAFVSAPIHASVSGKVIAIQKIMLGGGQLVDGVKIQSDGKMEISPDVKPPKIGNLDEFLKAVHESGLVGLGGAGFPTHVKLNVPKGKHVDTLIINTAECEPYITSDNRCAIEETDNIVNGLEAVKKWLGIHRVIIAVEGNKPDVIEKMTKAVANDSEVKVLTLRARYPQGAEKVLIQSCTDRRVPMGGLPADVGCIVMNITSTAFLGNYLATGMPLVKKRVTVDGSAIKDPKNVIAPIGTSIRALADFCGGYKEKPKKILIGGPMMGVSIFNDEVPIVKQNNGILFFDEKEAHKMEPTPCIRCGRCVNVCPMHLMPTLLEKYAKAKRVDDLVKLDVMDCMECGCCAYSCPAGRPLVQSIRFGKALVKARGKK